MAATAAGDGARVGDVLEEWRALLVRGGAPRHDAGEDGGREDGNKCAGGGRRAGRGRFREATRGPLQMPRRCLARRDTWWRRACELERRRPLTPLRGRLEVVACAGDHRLDGFAMESDLVRWIQFHFLVTEGELPNPNLVEGIFYTSILSPLVDVVYFFSSKFHRSINHQWQYKEHQK